MAFMAWSSKYEFGIPEMDEQHRHWLELLNNFYDGLAEQNMKLHLLKLLEEAIDYTHYHFEEEEKSMQNIGYPALTEQKKLHAEIGKKSENFRYKVMDDKPIVSMSITNEIKSWFKNHILVEDKKYVELYKSTLRTDSSD
jgi:hemerythrin